MTDDRRPGRDPGTDPLELAEAVAAGRLSVAAAEAALHASAGTDRERAAAVDEFRSLFVAIRGVRRHADAFRAGLDASGARVPQSTAPTMSAQRIDRSAVRVRRRPDQRSSRWAPAAGLLAAAVLVLAVVTVPRLLPSVASSPSPTLSLAANVPSPSPSSSAVTSPTASPSVGPTPVPTPTPSPTSAAPNIPPVPNGSLPAAPEAYAWAASSDGTIVISSWSPAGKTTPLLKLDGGLPGSEAAISRSVLAAPDGRAFAIAEHQGSGDGQIRIVNADGGRGYLEKVTGTPDLAWSADGSMLAYAVVPNGWTIVTATGNGTWTAKTYDPSAEPSALLGFSRDGSYLYGYYTAVEADYWERPIRMSLASGGFTELSQFPTSGIAVSNTSTKSDLLDPRTGRTIDSGTAQGASWEVRRGNTSQPTPLQGQIVGLTEGRPVVWGPGELVTLDEGALSTFKRSSGVNLATTSPGDGVSEPFFSLAKGTYRASLLAVRGASFAYVGVGADPSNAAPDGLPTWDELIAVDALTGSTAVFVPESDLVGGFHLAGWHSAP